jgi:hypothetical protein
LGVYDWVNMRRCEKALLALERCNLGWYPRPSGKPPNRAFETQRRMQRELEASIDHYRAAWESLPFGQRVKDVLRGIGG